MNLARCGWSIAYDVLVVKYDSFGNILWGKSAGSSLRDYGTGICTDVSGNVRIVGYFKGTVITFDQPVNNSGSNFDGFVASLTSTVSISEENMYSSTSLFPNPFNETFEIKYNGNKTPNELSIFDLSGKEVLHEPFVSNSKIIAAGGLAGGIYFYYLLDRSGVVIARGKIIKK